MLGPQKSHYCHLGSTNITIVRFAAVDFDSVFFRRVYHFPFLASNRKIYPFILRGHKLGVVYFLLQIKYHEVRLGTGECFCNWKREELDKQFKTIFGDEKTVIKQLKWNILQLIPFFSNMSFTKSILNSLSCCKGMLSNSAYLFYTFVEI